MLYVPLPRGVRRCRKPMHGLLQTPADVFFPSWSGSVSSLCQCDGSQLRVQLCAEHWESFTEALHMCVALRPPSQQVSDRRLSYENVPKLPHAIAVCHRPSFLQSPISWMDHVTRLAHKLAWSQGQLVRLLLLWTQTKLTAIDFQYKNC